MIKRLLSSILLAVLAVSLLGGTALAFLYRAPIAITENASTSYTMLPVLWGQNNGWLASNGFMSSTANDTRVQTLGGLNKPWMVADNKALTAIPVPAGSQTNLYFMTGESEASSMDIIVGHGGYVTVTNNAALDLGNNFEIEIDGYVNTTLGVANLIYRPQAFRVWTGASGEVSAEIANNSQASWVSPTSASGTGWTSTNNSWDGDTGTYATGSCSPSSWSNFLTLGIPAGYYNAIRVWSDRSSTQIYQIDVDAYYNGGWQHVYSGDLTVGSYVTYGLPSILSEYITAVRVSYRNGDIYGYSAYCHEVGVGTPIYMITASPITPSAGEHNIVVTGDGASTFAIDVDGVADSSGLVAVPAPATNWTLMDNSSADVSPYWNYYKHTVSTSLVAHYEPVAIVTGTTLPDRAGAAQNGVITWGSNPASVGVSLGSMVSSGQSSIGVATGTSTGDILPVTGGTDWRPDAGVSATLQANPLRPIVTAISDNTTLSEYQVWVWFGIIFVVFITVLVGSRVRGHHLITGIVASAAIILMVVWDIFPLLSLAVIVLAIWSGLVSERSPSL